MTPDQDDDRKLRNLKNRLETLDKKDREKKVKEKNAKGHDGTNLSVAIRACTELLVSIGVCGALGYGADGYFETRPLFMIIGLLLGMGVGFLGAYRISNNMGMSIGYMEQHRINENKEVDTFRQDRKKYDAGAKKERNSVSTTNDSDDKR